MTNKIAQKRIRRTIFLSVPGSPEHSLRASSRVTGAPENLRRARSGTSYRLDLHTGELHIDSPIPGSRGLPTTSSPKPILSLMERNIAAVEQSSPPDAAVSFRDSPAGDRRVERKPAQAHIAEKASVDETPSHLAPTVMVPTNIAPSAGDAEMQDCKPSRSEVKTNKTKLGTKMRGKQLDEGPSSAALSRSSEDTADPGPNL